MSRNFVPVALLDSEIWNAKDAAGEFFRAVNKQMFINQGIHIATADGKALASCMPGRSQDGKEVVTDESKRDVWIKETQAALERGLRRFGEVKPRAATTGDPLPSDAVGVHPDGSVSLASYTRTMHLGLNPDGFGPPAIDDATLTAKEWAALAPAKAVPGTEWTVPESVARKLNPVLSTSCNDSLPSPKEVSAVRFTAKVESVENGVAYLTYEGSIAGAHKSVHGYVWTSEAKLIAGVGAYDVKAGKMLSFTLVFEGSRRNSRYHGPADRPERFGAVLEWRLAAEKPVGQATQVEGSTPSEIDLTKIPRTIAKEPAYQSKAPRYGLLVFGPKAEQRVWLVLDHDVLYVDANGNGDLTEPGERVKVKTPNQDPASYEDIDILGVGGKTKEKLRFALYGWFNLKQGKDEEVQPSVTVSWQGRWYGAWGDGESPLRFAARPQDAPILHVGGPLQMGFESRLQHALSRKSKDTFELAVGVGTKGLGKGSFTHLTYWDDAIPKDAQPTAELEFPSKTGEPPIKIKQVLKERC